MGRLNGAKMSSPNLYDTEGGWRDLLLFYVVCIYFTRSIHKETQYNFQVMSKDLHCEQPIALLLTCRHPPVWGRSLNTVLSKMLRGLAVDPRRCEMGSASRHDQSERKETRFPVQGLRRPMGSLRMELATLVQRPDLGHSMPTASKCQLSSGHDFSPSLGSQMQFASSVGKQIYQIKIFSEYLACLLHFLPAILLYQGGQKH